MDGCGGENNTADSDELYSHMNYLKTLKFSKLGARTIEEIIAHVKAIKPKTVSAKSIWITVSKKKFIELRRVSVL